MRSVEIALIIPLLSGGTLLLADGADLEVRVTSDRQSYLLGAPVALTVTKCNPTGEAVTVTQGCPCCNYELQILDSAGEEVAHAQTGCIQVVIHPTWQPGECTHEAFLWTQRTGIFDSSGYSEGSPVEPGVYTAKYSWAPVGFSTEAVSAPFTVAPTEIPTISPIGMVLLVAALLVLSILRMRGGIGSRSTASSGPIETH